MRSVEIIARSVEEAVEEGLEKLGATRDDVDITVLDEGNKGLFGILGAKQAKVRIELKVSTKYKSQVAQEYLHELLRLMQVSADIHGEIIDEDNVRLAVYGDNLGLLIGRRGQTLDALQYLVSTVANREGGNWVRIIMDVEGYRSRREYTLKSLAQRLAANAIDSGRRVALDPMTALERRIIHTELQANPDVETHSEGREPYRRVIIVPKK
jgi:spoIIIJ-associated protein